MSTATETTELRVYVESTGALVGDAIRHSGSSEERRKGLLKDKALEPGSGMLIVPCEGIHTFFMKFPIDVVFLDKSYRIIKTAPEVAPWRIRLCLRAHSTLELPAGVVRTLKLRKGQALRVERAAK